MLIFVGFEVLLCYNLILVCLMVNFFFLYCVRFGFGILLLLFDILFVNIIVIFFVISLLNFG